MLLLCLLPHFLFTFLLPRATAFAPPRGLAAQPSSTRALAVMLAKKKGGGKKGKKGKNQKPSVNLLDFSKQKPFESSSLRSLAEAAANGYLSRSGKPLHDDLRNAVNIPKALWNAPVACMIVGKPLPSPMPRPPPRVADDEVEDDDQEAEAPAEEPVEKAEPEQVLYCNVAALEAHGLAANAWNDLIGKPTTLAGTMSDKFDGDYSKKISAAEVFTLKGARWAVDKMEVVDGKLATSTLGICYAWESWELEDGWIRKPGGVREEKPPPPPPKLSKEELEAAVAEQGAAIRKLKEEDGFGNKDEPVVEAVLELKRLKALLEEEA